MIEGGGAHRIGQHLGTVRRAAIEERLMIDPAGRSSPSELSSSPCWIIFLAKSVSS